MPDTYLPMNEIRAQFARALSRMYAMEVPLYQTLVDTVREVNHEVLGQDPKGTLARVTEERHGAIRLGTADEMKNMARVFAVMGMYPVDYYDLTVANLPVHSTAFRPITEDALATNPFRVFTSVLRMDILEAKHADAAALAKDALAKRQIFSPKLLELVRTFESRGGLSATEAETFISEAMKTFRWHEQAAVSKSTYETLLRTDALLADVASFQGPHINHLTPRVLDIDLLYARMKAKGITMTPIIQGPPKMEMDILLRQTSFQALVEPVTFAEGESTEKGQHRARFGEIEQRGVALTPEGRARYDTAILKVEAVKSNDPRYNEVLGEAFKDFPRGEAALRKGKLAYFRYSPTKKGLKADAAQMKHLSLDQLVENDFVYADGITYEDFLPVSAAGIFKSNLVDGGTAMVEKATVSSRAKLEAVIGTPIIDPFALYAATEARSILATYEALGLEREKGERRTLEKRVADDPAMKISGHHH
ncbi:MAG: VOC family protein [Proteobacteria bacterium]|nr:VOC family protein [Pseudomonadota bacterium]